MADLELKASVAAEFDVVEKRRGAVERLAGNHVVRKLLILVVLAAVWQAYALRIDNPLLFPSFTATVQAFADGITNGGLLSRAWVSIRVLLAGYATGLLLATMLTVFAITSRIGEDLLEILTAMFNPLPAIALLPLALLWFGLGPGSLVFVLVHSVLWAVALNAHSGFKAVSATQRMVGRNYQ